MLGPDAVYLAEECGGVPLWEVQMLVDPPPAPSLTIDEHESLLGLAQRAKAAGDIWRAHGLAEQAYAGTRAVLTLLYLLDLRVNHLGEVAFGAAAYHSMLRMLPPTAEVA